MEPAQGGPHLASPSPRVSQSADEADSLSHGRAIISGLLARTLRVAACRAHPQRDLSMASEAVRAKGPWFLGTAAKRTRGGGRLSSSAHMLVWFRQIFFASLELESRLMVETTSISPLLLLPPASLARRKL
jgi:hypothetical protein